MGPLMPLDFHPADGALVWVRNPFTGVITYFTDLHRKRSGFPRRARPAPPPPAEDAGEEDRAAQAADLARAMQDCPFCPGNEDRSPIEVARVAAPGHRGWQIRVVENILPRVPESCTGGRNESYVIIEDPRHFVEGANGADDLFRSGLLTASQFEALLTVDVEVARRAYANPAVRHVLIRKNQGRDSGASQPHVHNQVIGSDQVFPSVAREREVCRAEPRIWEDILAFVRRHDFVRAKRDGCVAFFCPFGTFPRSYDILCPKDWVRLTDLPAARWRVVVEMLHDILRELGPMPLDYEIHDGPGQPLHVHVNARHYPYSNIGGTLNLPTALLRHPEAGR